MSNVKVVTRVSQLGEETVISRGEELVAVLPGGDPLRFLLELPVGRLRSMKRELSPVLAKRPQVVQVFDAIIEYREEGDDDEQMGFATSGKAVLSEVDSGPECWSG